MINFSYYFSSEFSTKYSPLDQGPDCWRPPPHALRHDLADRHDAEVRARRPVQPPLLRSGRHPGSGGDTHCVRHRSVALQQAASLQYAGRTPSLSDAQGNENALGKGPSSLCSQALVIILRPVSEPHEAEEIC